MQNPNNNHEEYPFSREDLRELLVGYLLIHATHDIDPYDIDPYVEAFLQGKIKLNREGWSVGPRDPEKLYGYLSTHYEDTYRYTKKPIA